MRGIAAVAALGWLWSVGSAAPAAEGLDACFAAPSPARADAACDATCRLHRIAAPVAECAFAVVAGCVVDAAPGACLAAAVGAPDPADLPSPDPPPPDLPLRSEVSALLAVGHGPSERLVAFAYDDDRPCGIPAGAMDAAVRDDLCRAYPVLETRVAAEAIRRWWPGEAVR